MAALVFDLGGTHLRCALADDFSSLKKIRKQRIKSFIHGFKPDIIWKDIINSIITFEAATKRELPANSPIILSFPGPIASPSQILDAPTIVGKAAAIPDLKAELHRLTGRPIHIINDISAAAWHFSLLVTVSRFIVITVSSGIGSKIFDHQNPLGVLDDVPYGGEIGHTTVDYSVNALRCDCGGKGHLGAISSGRGILRFARQAAQTDLLRFSQSECAVRYGAEANSLTNEKHLVPAAKNRDAWALDIVYICTVPLVRTLLPIIAAAGLMKVILIGGFALALGDVYLEILQRIAIESCDYRLMAGIENLFMLGAFKEEACLEGAAVYASRCPSEQ